MSTRICTICGRELPATSEFFSRDRDWLSSRCKQCRNKYFREYRQKNKNKISEYFKKNRKTPENHNKLRALHIYIKNHKKKPEYCQICNEKRRLQLASINHTYTRNPEDYLYLCQFCHSLFDKCMEGRISGHS